MPLVSWPGAPRTPVVFCVMDGVGWGRRDDTDAVFVADTPVLDRLMSEAPHCLLVAHGRAVGLPSDADMGNSEVGHNAFGAGRVVDQGAKLVDEALRTGGLYAGRAWQEVVAAARGGALHLIGLVSDGNVHSHVAHLRALIRAAAAAGVGRIRVHALTDGRDVSARSALSWILPLEAELDSLPDARIASGGGRMRLTMDRYEADWEMVARGWRTHVEGEGRRFASAGEAIQTFYEEDPAVDDQWLPAFVVARDGSPVGIIQDGDAVVLFNFRGDRAIEISRAFEEDEFPCFERGRRPRVTYAGMMEYDGDRHIPSRFLVEPPTLEHPVGEHLCEAGRRSFAVSETQKFGHVTYFFNGNRSGRIDPSLEEYVEIPSDNVQFQTAPAMQAERITDAMIAALRSGQYDHLRLNWANGDMVGHSGDFAATVQGVEVVDRCLGRLLDAAKDVGAIVLITADHGNADEMFELDKSGAPVVVGGHRKPRTSHSLNPVPCVLVDPTGFWALDPREADAAAAGGRAGIASIGPTLLALAGLYPPDTMVPALVVPARPRA